jgi:hypothetical protein
VFVTLFAMRLWAQGPGVPTLVFTATPSAIVLGSSATLSWTATNVTSCTASEDWAGPKALSGTQAVSPGSTGTWAYFLNCAGSNGSVSAIARVVVSAGPPPLPPSGGTTIALNPAVSYQTIKGWEVPVLGTMHDYDSVVSVLPQLMDLAANDIGLNEIAIGARPGMEQPDDCDQQYIDGLIDEGTWAGSCAWNSVNDNADPNVANLAGFHFSILDWQVDHQVLPLKQKIEARGEKLRVVLRFGDFGATSFEYNQDPPEYGELMLVIFDHLRAKYGFVPDAIDVMNEPDTAYWDGAMLGAVVAATGPRLAAAGYQPQFIVASTVNKANAVAYFDDARAVPGASPYITEISWHCYGDSSPETSSPSIGAKALEAGVGSAMTECWSSSNTYESLHAELKTSRNTALGLAPINSDDGYFDVTRSGQITLHPKARYIRQYFRYIRAGATRIEAVSSESSFDPVAFVNSDGTYVVVVKARAGGSFSARMNAAAWRTTAAIV